jgi:Zn-dependent protease with chaperone function
MRRALEAQAAAAQLSREVMDKLAERRDATWRAAAKANRERSVITLATPLAFGVVVLALGVLSVALLVLGALLVIGWAAVATLTWRSAVSGSWLSVDGVAPGEAVKAGALPAVAAARFEDVAESLCVALGLPVPTLRVVVDPAPNAITAGGHADQAKLVVTTGLLAAVDRIELEGLVAHELAHVKRLDTLSGGVSAALLHGGRLPVPGARRLATWLEGPEREVEADMAAVAVTRYPPGLSSPLEKVAAAPSCRPDTVSAGLLASTASQWIAPPLGDVAPRDGHYGFEDRLDLLREL